MEVKLFDFEHEEDLEDAINLFLKEEKNIVIDKILYQVSNFGINGEQIYSFSCMLVFERKNWGWNSFFSQVGFLFKNLFLLL